MRGPPNKLKTNSNNIGHSSYNALNASPETITNPNWYLDSGVSHHITNNSNTLSSAEKYAGKENLTVGNGQEVKISHICTSFIQLPSKTLTLQEIIYSL